MTALKLGGYTLKDLEAVHDEKNGSNCQKKTKNLLGSLGGGDYELTKMATNGRKQNNCVATVYEITCKIGLAKQSNLVSSRWRRL